MAHIWLGASMTRPSWQRDRVSLTHYSCRVWAEGATCQAWPSLTRSNDWHDLGMLPRVYTRRPHPSHPLHHKPNLASRPGSSLHASAASTSPQILFLFLLVPRSRALGMASAGHSSRSSSTSVLALNPPLIWHICNPNPLCWVSELDLISPLVFVVGHQLIVDSRAPVAQGKSPSPL